MADGKLFGFSDNSWLDPIYGLDADAEASLVAGAGANSHRVFFDWRYAEPQRDVYREPNFAHYTRMYDALLARGIRPLITVAFAPRWAWEPLTLCDGELCRYPPARSMNSEWAEIVSELARRYPQAVGIEIWNEPNIDTFWRNPDPQRYAELARIARAAVRGAGLSVPIVAGALGSVPSPPPEGDVPTRAFLDAAYRHRLAEGMDVLSLHSYPYAPYVGPGSRFRLPLDEVRAVVAQHGDGERRLWITEAGVSTSDSRPGLKFTPAEQASILLKIYREFRAMTDVDALFIHSLLERPRERPWNQEFGYGVMTATQPPTPKPAYCALAGERSQRPQGC